MKPNPLEVGIEILETAMKAGSGEEISELRRNTFVGEVRRLRSLPRYLDGESFEFEIVAFDLTLGDVVHHLVGAFERETWIVGVLSSEDEARAWVRSIS